MFLSDAVKDKKKPSLYLEFKNPQHGFWDGGAKTYGEFIPTPCSNGMIKWGCWELNFWFTLPFGKSWADAVAKARRKIKRITRPTNTLKTIWA